MLDFASMIYRIPALLFAISIHEYAHAQCADSMGDPTARYMGRLTFNPLAHLDPIGAILLVVAGFGWAKGVPINVNNFRNRREGILKVSFAGPAANLFLCFVAAFMMAFLGKMHMLSDGLYRFLFWMQLYNVWFAFFNLIPVPPLDGANILAEIVPAVNRFYSRFRQYGWLILLLLLGTRVLYVPMEALMSAILSVLKNVVWFILRIGVVVGSGGGTVL